jgi:hypothetical protein
MAFMLCSFQILTSNSQLQDSLHRLMMRVRPAPLEDCKPSTIIKTVRPVIPTTIGNRFKKMHLGTAVYELHLSFGVIRIRMVKETVIDKCSPPTHSQMIRHHKHWNIVATLLPKFTLWRVLEFSFTQRFNSIGAGLRTFNIRPGWSPIFEYSSRGDLQSVRRLVEDGLASPNDVDPDGWTVLHVSSVFLGNIAHQLNFHFSGLQVLTKQLCASCFLLLVLYQIL